MNLLELLISFRAGGAERVAVGLAAGLRKNRIQAHILALVGQGHLAQEAMCMGIPCRDLGLNDPRLFLAARRALEDHLARFRVAISHGSHADYALSLARCRCARVLTIHNVDFNRWRVPGFRLIDRAIYRRADALVACSSLSARAFSRQTGIDESRITVIRNGVDTARFKPVDRPGSRVPKILVVARFFPQKAHDLAMRAGALLHARGLDFQMVFAGDGPLRSQTERLARDLLPPEKFWFPGVMKDMASLYGQGDILFISSHHEGIPVSMLEAMSAGLPVVATGVGGIPEVVRHGTEGFLVPRGDAEAMADGLETLLRDGAMRQEQGTAARKRVEEGFSLDTMTGQYMNLVERLA